MIAILPTLPESEKENFAASVLMLLILACGSGWLVIALVTKLTVIQVEVKAYVIATATAITAFLIKEFHNRYFFSHAGRQLSALAIQIILAFVLLVAVTAISKNWTSVSALYVYSAAHAASAVVGILLAKLPLLKVNRIEIRRAFSAILPGGLWAAFSAVVYTVRSSAHTFIIASTAGPSDVGLMNAARVLVTPATMLIPALSYVILPQLARLNQTHHISRVYFLALRTSGVIFAITLVYSTALIFAWGSIQTRILGEAYAESFWIVVWWCFYSSALALRCGVELALQALTRFKKIFYINIAGAVVSLCAVLIFSYFAGIVGAIAGATVGEAIVAIGFLLVCRNMVLSDPRHEKIVTNDK